MPRPPRGRQRCATLSLPCTRATIKRGGRLVVVITVFAFTTILPNRAMPQTPAGSIPTGAAIIPKDLPARASTLQSGNGPVSLLPGTIPANDTIGNVSETPSLAIQYHQTLTGTARAVPLPASPHTRSRLTKPTPPAAKQGLPTANDLLSTIAVTPAPSSAANRSSRAETALPTITDHYLIQLGAFRDAITAETYWASFRIRYPDLAKTYTKQIVAADLGTQGIYHRLQLTGFPRPETAKQQCRQLQTDGTDCFVAYP